MASLNNLVIMLLRHPGFANLAHTRRLCKGIFNHPNYLAIRPTLT